jgi:hypothetical protein
MFHDAKRAFYQMAISMPLKRISTTDYVDWILHLYHLAGKSIEETSILDVVARCENHPKYIQEFFYYLWMVPTIRVAEINAIENKIIEQRSIEFSHIWDSLSLNQRKALKLVAVTGGKQMFSADNLVKFKFKTASQVTASLKVLVQRALVSKNGEYQVYDPVLRKWIQRLV